MALAAAAAVPGSASRPLWVKSESDSEADLARLEAAAIAAWEEGPAGVGPATVEAVRGVGPGHGPVPGARGAS